MQTYQTKGDILYSIVINEIIIVRSNFFCKLFLEVVNRYSFHEKRIHDGRTVCCHSLVAAWETKCWSRSSYSGEMADAGGRALPPQLSASSSVILLTPSLLAIVVAGTSKWDGSLVPGVSFTVVPERSGEGMLSSLSCANIDDRSGFAEEDGVDPVTPPTSAWRGTINTPDEC